MPPMATEIPTGLEIEPALSKRLGLQRCMSYSAMPFIGPLLIAPLTTWFKRADAISGLYVVEVSPAPA